MHVFTCHLKTNIWQELQEILEAGKLTTVVGEHVGRHVGYLKGVYIYIPGTSNIHLLVVVSTG